MKKIMFAMMLVQGISSVIAADLPKITMLTDPGFVPFESKNPETGEFEGFDIDLIKAVGKIAGFQPMLKSISFDGIIPALQTGHADGSIAGMTITEKRKQVVDFSDPYYDSGLKLLVRANDDSIHTIADLGTKKVATKNGSTGYNYMVRHMPKGTQNISYPNTSDMFVALLGGSVDAVFHDAPNVAYFAKVKGHGKVKVLEKLYEGQQYGIAFSKGNKWLKPTNKALAKLKENGTYQKIYDKYFGD